MKHIFRLFCVTIFTLSLFSCAVQQHTENPLSIYQAAMTKYEKKGYYDAKKLFQEVIPLLKGKIEIISAQFYLAYCYFYEKEYSKSAHYFTEFCKTYPRIQQTEEARYMQGYSLYLDSPDSRLDATTTEEALKVLQQYSRQYPTGIYSKPVQEHIRELQNKLALKAFLNAKLYYNLGHYRAAIITINIFQDAYPGAVCSEEAIYIKTNAQCKLAQKAATEDQLNSWNMVLQYYYELIDQYPNSKYVKNVQAVYAQALDKVEQLTCYACTQESNKKHK